MSHSFVNRLLQQVVLGAAAGLATYGIAHYALHSRQGPADNWPVFPSEVGVLKRADEFCKYGIPEKGPPIIIYENHCLHYDYHKRVPLWVAEHLTEAVIKGSANRKASEFRADTSIPELFQSQNTDYSYSGWSRGHMAAAANNKHSQDAMDSTFLLSNILPQDLQNNAGYWAGMEDYCRRLTHRFNHVYVISGPLYLSQPAKAKGKRMVSYEVIGDNEVSVPTHLFKVIVVEGSRAKSGHHSPATGLAAFIVPNAPIDMQVPLTHFQVAVEQIERQAGLLLLQKLQRTLAADLCKIDHCKLRSYSPNRAKSQPDSEANSPDAA